MAASVTQLASERRREELLPLDLIDRGERIRTPRPARVAAIAADMAEHGQREAIEVAPGKKGAGGIQRWLLVDGAVRVEALRLNGAATVRAAVVRLSAPERRQREVDTALLADGLTVLDRALYLAAGKRLYEDAHPETRRGAPLKVGAARVANLATREEVVAFTAHAAARYGLSRRSIERACAIGERLIPAAAALLAPTDWGDQQAALETISKLEANHQVAVATLLTRAEAPVESLPDALAAVLGTTAPDATKKAWSALEGGWGRLSARDQTAWLRTIKDKLPKGVRLVFEGDDA